MATILVTPLPPLAKIIMSSNSVLVVATVLEGASFPPKPKSMLYVTCKFAGELLNSDEVGNYFGQNQSNSEYVISCMPQFIEWPDKCI